MKRWSCFIWDTVQNTSVLATARSWQILSNKVTPRGLSQQPEPCSSRFIRLDLSSLSWRAIKINWKMRIINKKGDINKTRGEARMRREIFHISSVRERKLFLLELLDSRSEGRSASSLLTEPTSTFARYRLGYTAANLYRMIHPQVTHSRCILPLMIFKGMSYLKTLPTQYWLVSPKFMSYRLQSLANAL